MKIKASFIIAAVAVMVFTACDNDSADTLIAPSGVTSVALEASVEEVENVLDDYALYGGSYLNFGGPFGKGLHDRAGFFASCAAMEEETVDDTTTITITFPEDCEDKRGDTISGTITIVKSTSETDRSRTVTFTDFSVNGYVVNGTKTFEYTAVNENGVPQIEGTKNLTIETDEGTITKSGTRLVEITSGGDTDTHSDDERTITGSSTLTDAEGTTRAVEITTPLVKPAECRYISQGVKEISVDGETSTLDYGDGTCDNLAILTEADGTVTEIELKRRRRGFRK